MLIIRYFEEYTLAERARPSTERLIPGYLHPCIGQEATAVGACAALEDRDKIVSTHRGNGHLIAKGADINQMMAELAGKATGYTNGRGGPLHMSDLTKGILGTQGIVGAGLPIAVGSALSSQVQKENWVTLVFFGDGAVDQGVFHESINIASLWELPIIFFCENNHYSEGTHITHHLAVKELTNLVSCYGIRSYRVDGNDVLDVYEKTSQCVEEVRNGNGPTFIEANTYRLKGHYHGDKQEYQPSDELEYWEARDPIRRMKELLLDDKRFSTEQVTSCERNAHEMVQNAILYAKNSSPPLFDDIFLSVYRDIHGGDVF